MEGPANARACVKLLRGITGMQAAGPVWQLTSLSLLYLAPLLPGCLARRARIQLLDDLEADGWQLTSPVLDDYMNFQARADAA